MAFTVLHPLPVTVMEKPPTESIIFETKGNGWSSAVLNEDLKVCGSADNTEIIKNACQYAGAEFITGQSSMDPLARLSGEPEAISIQRQKLLSQYSKFSSCVMPLDGNDIFVDLSQRTLRTDCTSMLVSLSEFTGASLRITKGGQEFSLHISGLEDSVAYAKYKARVLFAHLAGYALRRMEIPLSQQPLVFGPSRAHLKSIYQQTNVNVFGPPLLSRTNAWCVDEVYLTGDPVQVTIAEKMLQEIVSRTEHLVKSVSVASYSLDSMQLGMRSRVLDVMNQNATFVLFPSLGLGTTVTIMGTTVSSIERTIDAIMALSGTIYSSQLAVHTGEVNRKGDLVSTEHFVFDAALLASVASSQSVCISANDQCVLEITGTGRAVVQALTIIANHTQNSIPYAKQQLVVKIEASTSLKDFLAGKKSGKVLKIMGNTQCNIAFSPLHEYSFRLNISGTNAREVSKAVSLIEDELPAEKHLYIPDAYHKQVIGAGGSRIQTIMRNFNVFIKFGSSGDRVPNAFGRLEINNVLIRCPYKNAHNIEPAAAALKENVGQWAREHQNTYLKLSRSHRRFLATSYSNQVRDIERKLGVYFKFPEQENKSTELVEIVGLGSSSYEAAIQIKMELPSDFEFRVSCSNRFQSAVGPDSSFASRIVAPFRVAFGAQVQSFERVQMAGDDGVYAQIVVTTDNVSSQAMEEISSALKSYLRDHGLDIIDKGELTVDPIVEGSASASVTRQGPLQNLTQNTLLSNVGSGQKFQTPLRSSETPKRLAGFHANTVDVTPIRANIRRAPKKDLRRARPTA